MTRQFSIVAGLLVPLIVVLGSCTPKQFSSDSNSDYPDDPGPTPQGIIQCSPSMNGGSTVVTLSPTGPNPSLAANCNPSGVNYAWTVTRNGTVVSINGLSGANSVPDFVAAGPGTYEIGFTATATGWTTYTLGTPLVVTVQNPNPGTPNITCSPSINGSQTSITLGATNPQIDANCNPAGVSYVWTVTRGGSTVTVPGLSGATSTPDFLTAGAGTYSISLSATQTGYTGYTSPSPLTVTVPAVNPGTPQDDTHNITVQNNRLDILLVIDDSKSMLADNQRLAARMQGFVNDLSSAGMDWQMCLTLTRPMKISESNPNYYWGASYNWAGHSASPQYILKKGTTNLWQIFENTVNHIGAGWAGTDDERAIKAAWWHLWNGEPGVAGTSGCYRDNAGLAVIILSDEDERSIGGDETQAYYASERNKPLENDDLPQTYVNYVRTVFGAQKRFTVNSIIVRPGDNQCMQAQDAEGSKSHFGVKYAELSNLTQGYIGSICDSDYSNNLKYFKDAIVRSQASVPLKCTPTGQVTVTVSPNYTHTSAVNGTNLVFTPQIPAGSTVRVQYTCP